ncbi:MAG: PAS domain S-box protein, partial [Candidatus Sulfotelmatobacter sp.]
MDLHPGPKQCQVFEVERTMLDPIRRALQENDDWYQDLVEHSQDLLCIHDLGGRLLAINPAPARLLGYSVEELLKIPMRELVPPKARDHFDAYLGEIERSGEARGFLEVMTRGGERRIWEYHNTLRTEGVGSPIVRGIAHDVTDQKRKEKLLRETGERLFSEARENERIIRELALFRTLVDNCNDCVEVVDPKTLRLLDVNQKACLSLGYSRDELLSLTVLDIDPKVTPASVAAIGEKLRNAGSLVMETVHRRKDGSVFPVEISMKWVGLDRQYVVTIAHDLTARKQGEALFQASERRYRALYDRSPVGICWVDSMSGRFLGVNQKYCEIVGRTEADLLGRDFQSITHPDDLPENCAQLKRLVKGEIRHYRMEKRYIRPDGSVRWTEIAIEAMATEAEQPIWNMAIVQDITKRKNAEELAGEYEKVVEGSSEIILVVDRQYRYMLANRAYLHYRGVEKKAVIEHTLPEVMGKELFETTVKSKMDDCFRGNVVQFEKKYEFANLGERDMAVSYFPIEGPSGVERVACIMQDITVRKHAEDALRDSEARERAKAKELEAVLNTVPVAVYIARDAECQYITTNRAGYEQLRQPVGANISKSAPSQERLGFRLLRDGIEVSADQLPMQRAAATGHAEYEVPLSLVFEDGTERHALFNAVPMMDEKGDPTGVVGASIDITERKRAEDALRERERTQKLILDHLPVGLILSSVGEERVLYHNPRFLELFGYAAEQIPTIEDWWRLAYPDPAYRQWVSQEWYRRMAEAVNKEGEIEPLEATITCRDGSKKYVRVLAKVIGDRNFITIIDLSERKRTEGALKKSEEKFSKAFRLSPVAITITTIQRPHYVEVNEAFERMTGWRRHEAVGRQPLDTGIWVNPAGREALIKRLLAEGCIRNIEVNIRRKDGEIRVGLGTAELIELHGEPCAITAFSDVTERKQAQQELRDAKEFSDNLIQTANVMILGLDTEGNVNLLNGAGEEITGYSFSELKGTSWSRLVPRDRFPQVWEEFNRLMEGKAGQYFENPIVTKAGEERYIAWRSNQVKVNGVVVATISFGNDITERKRAEEALRRSEEDYRMFVSQSSEGIFREDMDAPVPIDLPEDELVRHILYDAYMAQCNDAQAAMYGLKSGKELAGKRLTEMLPPEDPHNIALTRDYIRSGFRILDRASHEVDIHGNPKVFLNSMIGVVEKGMLVRTWGIQRDVTETVKLEDARRKAEEALRENVAQLQAVSEELRLATEKLSEEKLYLEQTIDTELGFGEIIGRSAALQEVMGKVAKVAPSDATVLLLGETGTGKELVARAVHRMSKRKENSFVKLNCAAIPSGLLESELFGHE